VYESLIFEVIISLRGYLRKKRNIKISTDLITFIDLLLGKKINVMDNFLIGQVLNNQETIGKK
jgi:hypothetical protein